MYRILDRRGRYLARDRVPCEWSPSRESAVGYALADEARRVIARLWSSGSIRRAVGARVVYEA